MAARWVGIFSLLLSFLLPSWAQESFRTFKTDTGQPFVGRVLSYEGQTFYVQGRDGKLFAIPFKKLSPSDQKYLIQIAPKLPKGDPRKINRKDDQPPAPSDKNPESTSTTQAKESNPPSPPKPEFRPGSFFAYKPVNLGQDPGMTVEGETAASLPGPDEPVDFDKHILPIMAERCQSCHKAPYDKNGRTIHPKAGLQLDDYESIMKGNLDGTVVEAGKPDESYLYEVITLDEEEDMFMPPKGGALTPDQIDAIKRWIEEGAKPSTGGGSDGVADMSKGIGFHDHVFPILEERCLDCHGEPYVKNGRTIHPKAGLRLDTYEWVIKGNLDGIILEKGNPDESTLIAVITLDSDDSEIMPPKGDPLSEDEINLLKQWILEGAKENPSDTFSPPKNEDHVALASSDKD